MSDERATDTLSIGKALESLREAMRGQGGSTTDPARRRAAATLSELLRSDDDQLERFAARHLPGGKVDPDTIRALQDLVLGVARLVTMHGRDGVGQTEASALSASVRATLLAGLEALEKAPSGGASVEPAGAITATPVEPAGTITAPPPAASPPSVVAIPYAPASERGARRYDTPSYALAAASPGVAAPAVSVAPVPEAPLPAVTSPVATPSLEEETAVHAVPPSGLALPWPTPGSDAVDEEEAMNGTVCDDAPVVGPATPFVAAPPGMTFSRPAAEPTPARPGAHLAATAPLSRVPVGSALPFAAASAHAPAQAHPLALPMPLEHYAAFLAELSRNYAEAPGIRARYGIADEVAQRDLGAAFAFAFDRDPVLRATFDEILRRKRLGG